MSELTVLVSRDHQHVAIAGDIDMANAGELDAALAGLSGEVTVDCTEVTFINSTGFYSLDRGHEAALANGGTFAVYGMTSIQRRIAAILSVPYIR
jgi:anti-anti-sigma regulatory factor